MLQEVRFATIRQAARLGLTSEYRLRLMEKQGRLPGVRSGNRFLINVPMLEKQLEAESLASVTETPAVNGQTMLEV